MKNGAKIQNEIDVIYHMPHSYSIAVVSTPPPSSIIDKLMDGGHIPKTPKAPPQSL